MNILIISRADHTGAGYALMQAINEHTEHKARAISYKQTWLEYPADIFQPTPRQFMKWTRWADVFNVHSDTQLRPALSGRPVVMTYHGSYYRNRWQELNKRDRLRGYIQTALTIDLAMHGPRWIGRPMPDLSHMWQSADEFTVVHSPSQPARKGTALVRQACAELGVKLDVITGVTWKECLKRKARGHVLVDQVGPAALGYGTSAIEAWAMGMPVISCAPSDVNIKFDLKANVEDGHHLLPFEGRANSLDQLSFSIYRARESERYRSGWAKMGRGWLNRYHSPAYVAQETVKACKEAIE